MAETFGKRQQCKKAIRRSASGYPEAVVFTFRNGDVVELDMGNISSTMQAELAAHGAKQKIGDEGAKEQVTNAEEFAAAARKMVARIIDDTAFERQSGGFGGETDLARAVAEFHQKPLDVVIPWLKEQSSAQKAKMRVHEGIKKILDRMLEERAGDEEVDFSGLE